MRSGYWIPKAKNALSGYVILIAFPPQQWLDECAQRGGGGYTSTVCLVDVGTKRTERPDLRNSHFTHTTRAYGDR